MSKANTRPVDSVMPVDAASHVLVEKKDNVVTITFNRPDEQNALTPDMYRELTRTMNEVGTMQDVSVTVLKAKGDDFSIGNDMRVFGKALDLDRTAAAKEGRQIFRDYVAAYIDHPKILIAIVQGAAVGIAVTSLAMCDAVYASDKASFSTPFTQLNLTPEGCSTLLFPAIMGYQKASQLLFLGRKISAHKAMTMNLVTEVMPHWTFAQEANKRVQEFAQLPAMTACKSKNQLRGFDRARLHAANDQETSVLQVQWHTPEFIESVTKLFAMMDE